MFNVRPDAGVPGFRFMPPDNTPGFRVGSSGEVRPETSGYGRTFLNNNPYGDAASAALLNAIDFLHSGFPDEAKSADGTIAPTLVPAPGSGGSGWDKCTLMPGFGQFRMCLYSCPDGTIRRLHGIGGIGCPPYIFRNDGLGL